MSIPVDRGEPQGRTTVRVRYPEADRMGVAYHAHYLVWFELGRTELMRERGCAYGELEERDGVFFPVVAVGARYLRPARYDDVIDVRSWIVAVGGSRVRFEYSLTRADDTLLATGFSEHATVGRNGRPMRLPRELRERLIGGAGPAADGGQGARSR